MSLQELIIFLLDSYFRIGGDSQVLIYDTFHEGYKNINSICPDEDTVVIHTSATDVTKEQADEDSFVTFPDEDGDDDEFNFPLNEE